MKRTVLICAITVGLGTVANLRAGTTNIESASVSGDWGVWTGWFWPFNSSEPPNLYTDGEALSRFDTFANTNSQTWEYNNHGPGLNQPEWAGHCHAWAGASTWETMPVTNVVCDGVTFRPRDQAALMTEAYYNDTLATEISTYRPSPGKLWQYLRQEIMGQNPMHGHTMALIGNLTSYIGQVWNFPIYQYQIVYSQDPSGTCSGAVTLWFADDGSPGYADSLGLSAYSFTYSFSGVTLNSSGAPVDSGGWAGNTPAQYPTSIWRPYYPTSWTNYVINTALDANHLSQILGSKAVSKVVVAPPTLAMSMAGGQLVLSWSTNYSGFQLEAATSSVGPQTWTPVTPSPSVVGGNYCVTNSANMPMRLYRLHHP